MGDNKALAAARALVRAWIQSSFGNTIQKIILDPAEHMSMEGLNGKALSHLL
jgi:hypothetical protein